MHCQDLEKMRYLVFVKFLSWPSWANSETGFGLSTSKIPILGMSKMQGKKPEFFSHSEAFQARILFEIGARGPNLGPPDFSKEKYKGPMAPVVKKNWKITMKMHCQDFQKMLCLVFLWNVYLGHLGPTWGLAATSKIPIWGMSKTQGKPTFLFTFWGLAGTLTFW